jgi:hypothetical protein
MIEPLPVLSSLIVARSFWLPVVLIAPLKSVA